MNRIFWLVVALLVLALPVAVTGQPSSPTVITWFSATPPTSCPNALPIYIIAPGYLGAGNIYGNNSATTGTICALLNGGGGGSGTVTQVNTSSPLGGGPITGSGTLTCATCAIGPGSSTANHLAEWNGTDGLTLKDGGAFPATKDQCGVGLYNGGAAITAGTYTLNGRCLNAYGSTYTITGVQCYATASDSSTGNVSDSGSNALLTGVITPTAGAWVAGNQSATTTIANGVWTTWTIVAGGTSTAIQCVMSITHS